MESHPSYPTLAPFLTARQGGPLFLVFNDLVHSQKWTSVQPHHLHPVLSSSSAPKPTSAPPPTTTTTSASPLAVSAAAAEKKEKEAGVDLTAAGASTYPTAASVPSPSSTAAVALPAAYLLAVRHAGERPRVIVPLALDAPLSTRWFQTTFAALFASPAYLAAGLPLPPPSSASPTPPTTVGTEGERDPPVLYAAIVGRDASIVYYRLAKGVEKPHDVPE